MATKTIRVEVWSTNLKTWIPQSSYSNRRDADECKQSWTRLGHMARVVEIEHHAGPDFVNNRGE